MRLLMRLRLLPLRLLPPLHLRRVTLECRALVRFEIHRLERRRQPARRARRTLDVTRE
jgi:hypothetical protein